MSKKGRFIGSASLCRQRTSVNGPMFRYRITDPCSAVNRHDPAYKKKRRDKEASRV